MEKPDSVGEPDSGGGVKGVRDAEQFEAQRLLDVRLSGLLDTTDEQRFDRLTRLAAQVFGVPIALISIVDEERQWFKSAVGLKVRETPRNHSFCQHVVDQKSALVIEDARLDERMRKSPLVLDDPGLRFYAGEPIRGINGFVIGSVCVLDRQPRAATEAQLSTLSDIAALVEREINADYQMRQAIFEAEQAAYFDTLASLPNLRLLQDRAAQAIERARDQGRCVYLMRTAIPELSGLSILSHSDSETDRLIRICAARLREALDSTCTVARGLDDEFVVLCPDQMGLAAIQDYALRIRGALQLPVSVNGKQHAIKSWTGASIAPQNARGFQRLMLQAGAALKEARREGQDQVLIFNSKTAQRQNRRLDLKSRLRLAVEHGDMAVHYQPILSVDDREMVAAEALSRWTDSELGPVSPAEFIPLAEESGLIRGITRNLIRSVCEQLQQLADAGCQELPRIAINVPGSMLRGSELFEELDSALRTSGIPADRLTLEITEGSYFDADGEVLAGIEQLRELGVNLAIDDFGTGYASFGHLKNLPVAMLKLDRSFVSPIVRNKGDATIVQSLIAMARRLGIKVVAEGVEEEEQLTFLRAYQCDLAQGFLFDRALEAPAFRQRVMNPTGPGALH